MSHLSKALSFVKAVFGNGLIDQSRANIAVECPECGPDSGKKKFSINLESWQCHCWVCGLKSKNLTFILKKYFDKHTLNFYLDSFNISSSEHLRKDTPDTLEIKISLPENFLILSAERQSRDPDVKACLKYLKSRRVTEKDLWRYRLGTYTSGRLRRRIVMPSFDTEGELNYYVARAIDESSKPKYLNSSNKKTEIIFNDIDIDWQQPITIVEGPFDLMKCENNSTCLLGSEITPRSKLFHKIITNQTPVFLALDADMKEKSFKIAELLESYCCEVKIVDLGKFSDVGETSKVEFENLRSQAKRFNRRDFITWKIQAIRSGSFI